MNKEVELTARLTKKEYDRILAYAKRQLKHVANQKRVMVKFFKNKVDVRESLDTRYKITNKKHHFVFKKGALGSKGRKEYDLDFGEQSRLEAFVHLFGFLGYKTIDVMYREREIFGNDKLEITLVVSYPYYDIEVESLGTRTKKEALAHVMAFFEKMKIKPLNKSAYQAYRRLLDRDVNLIFPIKEFPKPLLKSPRWEKIYKEMMLGGK